MLITMDHDCTPDCPVCIPEEDLSKFFNRNIDVPKSMPTNRAVWLLYILYLLLAAAAVGDSIWVASAIFGRDLQSHVASGGLTCGKSSIGLAERLELIELLSKDLRLSLSESAQITTAKKTDTSEIEYPKAGPSSSHGNIDPPPAASSSEKKPGAPAAPHPTGKDHLLAFIISTVLILAGLTIGQCLSTTDSDNSDRDAGSELVDAETDSNNSGEDSVLNTASECSVEDSGWGTDSDYFDGDSGQGTDSSYSGGDSDRDTDADYSCGDSGLGTDPGFSGRHSGGGTDSRYPGPDFDWETDSDDSSRDSGWGLLRSENNPEGTSSCFQQRMTSSSFEAAGFPREVDLNITVSAERLAASTKGGFWTSNDGLSDNETTECLQSEDDEKNVQSEKMEKNILPEEMDEIRRDEKRRAATLMQARYRGHLVQMTRILAQLKEIARIEERLNRLKELAADGSFVDFIRRKESTAKLAIEEETTKLLLRLEGIQSSHPLVCQIRKLTGREIFSVNESFSALLSKSINTSR